MISDWLVVQSECDLLSGGQSCIALTITQRACVRRSGSHSEPDSQACAGAIRRACLDAGLESDPGGGIA
jgi:hypothetical protein